jgi:phenylacetic acid degradation operon negative regulatory protein
MPYPLSHYVYSSFAFFGAVRGWELPGRWFVEALAAAGFAESAVRQTLYRMERSGELTARREGREKLYTPSGYARAEIVAGSEKIFRVPEPWEGRWTVVHARFERDERVHRDRLQELLRVEGFAPVAPGLHVHPRPLGERVLAAVDPAVRGRVLAIRGERAGDEPDERFIARHWDIPALAGRYRKAVRGLEKLAAGTSRGDADAFRRRFEVVMGFLTVAWDDPGLPASLLPDPWPGDRARETAERLYRRFLPGALRYGDRVLERVGRGDLAGAAAS